MELEFLGGPNSGRYPKGSGKHPYGLTTQEQDVILDWAQENAPDAMDPRSPEGKIFTEALEKLPSKKGTYYRGMRVSPKVLDKLDQPTLTLKKHAATSQSKNIGEMFAGVDSGEFVPSSSWTYVDGEPVEKVRRGQVPVILKFIGTDAKDIQKAFHDPEDHPEKEHFVPAGSKFERVGSKMLPNGAREITYRPLKTRALGGPNSGRYRKGSGQNPQSGQLVGGKTFAQRFPKGMFKPKPPTDLTGADLLLAQGLVEETLDPRSTRFILPDGRRMGPVAGTGYHLLHDELARGRLNAVMAGGVIRYSPGGGIEAQVVPTHEQAQAIADDFKYVWKRPLFIDVANHIDNADWSDHQRIEEDRLSADAIRNAVKKVLDRNNPKTLGSATSGNYGHAGRPGQIGGSVSRSQQGIRWAPPRTDEEWKQETLAISEESPAAHPIFVMGLDPKLEGDTLRYVAAYGQDFKTMPRPSWVKQGVPQECFKNATLLVLEHPELTYVEGFAQTPDSGGIAVLHGWAVDKAGNVIDPTFPDGHSYFGVKYDRTAYLKQLQRAKYFGVVASDHQTTKKALATGAPRLRAQSLKTLGGPNSGRYRKGSGQNPQSGKTVSHIDMMAPLPPYSRVEPSGDTVTMYHVTSIEAAQKIAKEGFDPHHPNEFQGFESVFDGTYGWNSLDRARLEVQRSEDLFEGAKSEMAIIKFDVPKSELHRMRPDEDHGIDTPWEESYAVAGGAVEGHVPASWIRGTYVDKSAKLKSLSGDSGNGALDQSEPLGTIISGHTGVWPAEESESFSEPRTRFEKSVLPEEIRSLAAPATIHEVAESHESKFSIAFRYAFARARKAIKTAPHGSSSSVVIARSEIAMEKALDEVLPKMLHRVASEGGQVGLDRIQLRAAASHKFGSTQVQLPMDVAAQLAAFPIAEEDLTGDGRELDSHITVKYGLMDVAANEVSAALTGEDPAEATLGKTIVFEGVEDGTADAIVIEVHSDCLKRWNKKIEDAVETTESTHEYKPHATIAYVKPGMGKKYAGDTRFEGTNLVFDRIVLSSKDDQVVSLPIDGVLRAAADDDGPFSMSFNRQNPSVIEWAKRHAAELIKDITETTRKRIRLAVTELQEEGDWDFAHDRIMAAVGDEARADLIARHETMLAAGEGQRLGWEQAQKQGLLSGKERREWIITPDERTCPICMKLEGTTAVLNGSYPGGYDGPPAHVQCRCTEGIIG